jgi:hypothetical protein
MAVERHKEFTRFLRKRRMNCFTLAALLICNGVTVYSVLTDVLFLAVVLAVVFVVVKFGQKISKVSGKSPSVLKKQ